MRILISGAGGFLGQRVVDHFLVRGHSVRAILRPKSEVPLWINKVDAYFADLVRDDLGKAFDGVEAVVHLAGVTSHPFGRDPSSSVMATERLLAAMTRTDVRRIVHVSSLVVYDWSLAETILDENSPVLSNATDMGEYTVSKLGQEQLIWKSAQENELSLTVLRPGFIWGAGRADIAGMGRRFARFYLSIGPLATLPLCHVENCADAVVAATENPAAVGEIFNVIDHNGVRRWRYLYEYMRGTGQFGMVFPVPYNLGLQFAKLASFIGSRFFGIRRLPSLLTPRRFDAQFKPLAYSNEKIERKLNWNGLLDFEACLKATYRSTSDVPSAEAE
jgi:nucleoside-diphosphate-sugar epimerase